MNPSRKFHLIITIITVVIMFFAITNLLPLIESIGANAGWAQLLVTFFGAIGIYISISKILIVSLERVRFVKRIIFGPSDLHGTWLGHFTANDGTEIITVEIFEQTLDGLAITGTGYGENDEIYAQWSSDSSEIDPSKGKLVYTYGCTQYQSKTDYRGICVFYFERLNNRVRPEIIYGYSADLVDGVRTTNREHRLSDHIEDWSLARTVARHRFNLCRTKPAVS